MEQNIGSIAVGNIVKISESEVLQDYLIVHHGLPDSTYDSSCNGTWLIRKNIYMKVRLGSSDYQKSIPHLTSLPSLLSKYNEFIQSSIKTVKIPYWDGNGESGSLSNGSSGLNTKIFILSATELGIAEGIWSYIPTIGKSLEYFSENSSVAYYDEVATEYYTRTPKTDSSQVMITISESGSSSTENESGSAGIRPAFILPDDIVVLEDGTIKIPESTEIEISGQDENLGVISNDIAYTVSTNSDKKISITQTVNDIVFYSAIVDSGFTYNIPVMELPTGEGTIVITATLDGDSSSLSTTRTWQYTKTSNVLPKSGSVSQLMKGDLNLFPITLAESVLVPQYMGGSLDKILETIEKRISALENK